MTTSDDFGLLPPVPFDAPESVQQAWRLARELRVQNRISTVEAMTIIYPLWNGATGRSATSTAAPPPRAG